MTDAHLAAADDLQVLAGYVAMRMWGGVNVQLEPVYPPAQLDEAQQEALNERLRDAMPRDSLIMDLWDYDCHFEVDLDTDWFYGSAFGTEAQLASCADALCEYFLEKVDEHDLDYNQIGNDEWFHEHVREESRIFIRNWRLALCRQLLAEELLVGRSTS